jgi:hypothetical protein
VLVPRQLEPTATVGRAQHRDVRSCALEAVDAVDPVALEGCPALELHAEFVEERDRGLEVLDDDADVVELDCQLVDVLERW